MKMAGMVVGGLCLVVLFERSFGVSFYRITSGSIPEMLLEQQ